MEIIFLESIIKQFKYYKLLGDKTFEQLKDEDLCRKFNAETNSIVTIIKHLSGNMLSRWTDFLTTDGEKKWRNRDDEFAENIFTKNEFLNIWQTGWDCLFKTLQNLKFDDLHKIIFIRNQGHTVVEAINRQLAHYSYHVGQIVFIGKMIQNENWKCLSIPKGNSEQYNKEKFAVPQHTAHFTDEVLNQKKSIK